MIGLTTGIVLVGMIVTGFMFFLGDGAAAYGVGFDNSSLEDYNTLQEMNSQAKELQEKVTDIKTQTGVLDIIGGYLQSAYSAALTTRTGFNTLVTLGDSMFEDMQLDYRYANILKVGIMTIVILIISGIFLTYFIKVKP